MENVKGLLVGVSVSEDFKNGYKLYHRGVEIDDVFMWEALGVYVSELKVEDGEVCVLLKGDIERCIDIRAGLDVNIVMGHEVYSSELERQTSYTA